MLITPRSISRTAQPHTADEVLEHLRVYSPLSSPHPEKDLIMRMYAAALQRIESRTRRFLGTTDLEFQYFDWATPLFTSWYIIAPTSITLTYTDEDDAQQTYPVTFRNQNFCLATTPEDRKDDTPIDLTLTTQAYVRDDLNNAVLLLTAQWYENRGDQNIRGIPHWIETICANHAWQSF